MLNVLKLTVSIVHSISFQFAIIIEKSLAKIKNTYRV